MFDCYKIKINDITVILMYWQNKDIDKIFTEK